MKKFLLILLSLCLLIGLVGCQDGFTILRDDDSRERSEDAEDTDEDDEDKDDEDKDDENEKDNEDDDDDHNSGIFPAASTLPEPDFEVPVIVPASIVTEMPDEFLFMSGIGGWSTILHIHPDGSFDGIYSDSDMGDTGKGYPNGTEYESEFNGRFVDFKKISEFEYSMQVDYIHVAGEIDSVKIEDGTRIFTTEPYGLDNAEEFRLYLPGRPTADLPPEFIEWVAMPNVWSEGGIPKTLPFWGLYNVSGMQGFFAE